MFSIKNLLTIAPCLDYIGDRAAVGHELILSASHLSSEVFMPGSQGIAADGTLLLHVGENRGTGRRSEQQQPLT
jgi:hypothetical protein